MLLIRLKITAVPACTCVRVIHVHIMNISCFVSHDFSLNGSEMDLHRHLLKGCILLLLLINSKLRFNREVIDSNRRDKCIFKGGRDRICLIL